MLQVDNELVFIVLVHCQLARCSSNKAGITDGFLPVYKMLQVDNELVFIVLVHCS